MKSNIARIGPSFVTAAIAGLLVPALAAAAGLSRPTGLVATAVSSSAIDLTWQDQSTAELAFAIERSVKADSGFTEVGRTAANTTTRRDTGLAGGTTYYYRVRAIGDADTSAYSDVAGATTLTGTADTTAPSVPTGLTATPAACNQVNLAWTASYDGGSGVMAYNVFRNGTFLRQVVAPTTSTSDTGLVASSSYSYAVTAVDYAGNQSALSPRVTATTPACADPIAPSAPTGVRAVVFGCTRIDVFWNASTDSGGSGLKGYKIYRNGVFIRGVLAPGVSTSDTTVLQLSTYSYAVSAIDNANNESARSVIASATTPACSPTTTTTIPAPPPTTTTRPPTTTTRPPTTTTTTRASTTTTTTRPPDVTPPSVPTGIAATPLSCSQIRVSWAASTDPSGVRSYNVFRNGVLQQTVYSPATSITDTGLAASTVYSYSVSAVDTANNQSARSATASANTPACPDTTPPSTPTGLTVTAPSCSQTNVSWTASTDTGGSGLKSYRVYRNGAYLREVLAPATSVSDTGLTASTSYSYAVLAADNAGNVSPLTAAVSRTTPTCTTLSAPALVGFVPAIGGAKDVVLSGGRAYVASTEFGLAVASLASPSQPAAIGGANPPFYAERVAVSGSLAVVAGNSAGLRVVDISTPTAPRTLGTLSGTFPAVTLGSQYAYVLQVVPGNPSHVDLAVVDVRNPAAPAIVGRATVGEGYDVVLAGSLAYVAAGSAGLLVVDVTTPTGPRVVGSVNTPGMARAVAIGNGYAYVADETAVLVVNVATPTAPTVRGTLATAATAIAVAGTRVYAIGATQFKVIDVANAAAPALLGGTFAYGAQRLAVSGNIAYLASPEVDASRNLGGLYSFDVSAPATPRMLSNVHGRYENMGLVAGGSLAVLAGNGLGLKVLDVTAPTAPRPVGALAGTMISVSMAGQYAQVLQIVPGNPPHTDLVSVDLRVPSVPAIVGRVTLPGGLDVKTVGTLSYVAADDAGFRVVDVSSPTAPRIIGSATTSSTAHGVAVANGRAYVATDTAVVVIDVTSPTRPVVQGSYPTPAQSLAVVGTRLAVLGGMQLKMIDVANPAAPALLSAIDGMGAQGVAALGNVLFLATPAINHFDTAGGVHVVDVTNASAPRVVGHIIVPGTTRVATVFGNLIYAGDSASLIDVISSN